MEKRSTSNIVLSLILLGLFLNQSGIIFGINLSLADIFLSLVILLLSIKSQIYINLNQLLFFLLLLITVLFSGTIVNVTFLNSSVDLSIFIKEFIKLLVLFFYLTLGYNLVKLNLTDICIKSFFIGSVVISIISIFYSIFYIPFLRETLFFGANRFRGFMNDPNYFSVLQLTSLTYLLKNEEYKMKVKIPLIILIVLSIFFSGSKTGLIGLLTLSVFMLITNLKYHELTYKGVIKSIFLLLIMFFMVNFFSNHNILEKASNLHPSFERIYMVFTDFDGAVNGGGSSRESAWTQAIDLIKLSPIFGIGIGTYSSLNYLLSGSKTIAHNTYLQLMVEWGTIFTFLFMIIIVILLVKSFYVKNNEKIKIYRSMMIPFAIGSMSISLNNARLFWLLLGIILYEVTNKNNESIKDITL